MSENTHKWQIAWTPAAQRVLDKLPKESVQAVFDAVRPLLRADNPFSVRGVCKVERMKDVWRVHADTHNLKLRVFFTLHCGQITVNKFEYDGVVNIEGIRPKDANTYDK